MKFVGFTYSNPAWVMKPNTTLSPKARYGRGDDSLGMAADAPVTSRHKISRKVRTRGTMTASAAVGSQPLVRRSMRGRRSKTDDGAAEFYCGAGCGRKPPGKPPRIEPKSSPGIVSGVRHQPNGVERPPVCHGLRWPGEIFHHGTPMLCRNGARDRIASIKKCAVIV